MARLQSAHMVCKKVKQNNNGLHGSFLTGGDPQYRGKKRKKRASAIKQIIIFLDFVTMWSFPISRCYTDHMGICLDKTKTEKENSQGR